MNSAVVALARTIDLGDPAVFADKAPRVLEALAADGLVLRTDGGAYVNTPAAKVVLELFKELGTALWHGFPRIKLPNGHPATTCEVTLCVEADAFPFYLRIGRWPDDHSRHAGRPLEVFLQPRNSVKAGSMLAHYAEDAGESLSLLLQHWHTPASLYHRFKHGSLKRNAAGALLVISYQEGFALDAESAELAKGLAEEIARRVAAKQPVLSGVRP
jgi:hypothetical protein